MANMQKNVGEMKTALLAMNERFKGEKINEMGVSSLLTQFNKLSGSRCHLVYSHISKSLVLDNPEVPYVYTGYELSFGKRSNGFKEAESDYQIVARINKHSNLPNASYILVLYDIITGQYTVQEVIHYKSLSEIHGYLRESSPIDEYSVGQVVKKGEDFYRTRTTDKNGPYKFGINARAAFVSNLYTIADAVFISDKFAERASFHTIEETEIILNSNDLLLNIHGDRNLYKCLPNIGETISDDGVLCARRKINFNLAAANLTDSALMTQLESDDIFRGKGVLVDIDIFCNKQEELLANNDPVRNQLKLLFLNQLRYNREIYDILHPIISNKDNKYTFELRHLYDMARNYINNTQLNTNTEIQYSNNNGKFEYIYLSLKVAYKKKLECSDKISNRSGAKGVISAIIPEEEMYRDEDGVPLDICIAGKGIIGRLNIAQVYELELNYIANKIVKKVKKIADTQAKFDYIVNFIRDISEEQANELINYWKKINRSEKISFIEDIEKKNQLYIYQPPFYNNATLSQMDNLYKKYNIKPGYARFKLRFKRTKLIEDKYISKKDYEKEKFLYNYIFPPTEKMKSEWSIGIEDRFNKKKIVTAPDGKEYIRGHKFTMNDRIDHHNNSIFSKIANGLKVISDDIKENQLSDFKSSKSYISFDNKTGDLIRDLRTIRPLVMAPIYVMVLKQTADTGFSARSLGTINQLGMPVKAIKSNKGFAYNTSPIRYSFMDICNASSRVPMDIVHRFKSIHASNPELREMMAEVLLTQNPFKLHDLSIKLEDTCNDIPARMWKAYLWGLHIGFLEENDEDPFEEYDKPEYFDLNKIYKKYGTIDFKKIKKE